MTQHRDVRVKEGWQGLAIGEGTNDVLRMVVARSLIGGQAPVG